MTDPGHVIEFLRSMGEYDMAETVVNMDHRLEAFASRLDREAFENLAKACDQLTDATILQDKEIHRLQGVIQVLLDHCPDAECSICAAAVCPHGEPFHFHHDGCPACAQAETVDGQ